MAKKVLRPLMDKAEASPLGVELSSVFYFVWKLEKYAPTGQFGKMGSRSGKLPNDVYLVRSKIVSLRQNKIFLSFFFSKTQKEPVPTLPTHSAQIFWLRLLEV